MSRPLQVEGMIHPPSFFSARVLEGIHDQPLSDSPLDLSGDVSSLWVYLELLHAVLEVGVGG